jgi:hypothetical protein
MITNPFTLAISQIFKNAFQAFQTFPAVIGNALAFSVVTLVRIHLDWPEQEAFNFLFNCLHWSFAFGAFFSLMTLTFTHSRVTDKRGFMAANLVGILVPALVFTLLYTLSGTTEPHNARFMVLSAIATARVGVGIWVSFLLFILLAGYPKDQSNFEASFFMTHKAFFVALIYGVVIMIGVSGVAGAVQALLYNDMSEKVYMYLGTIVGFLAFTIFVGYFPDFRIGRVDERRSMVQAQPRFVQILFEFIVIPIMLAMTVVLFLWAGRAIVTGTWPVFSELAGIISSYTLGGLWLYIMVTEHDSVLTGFYKKVYPLATLLILIFAAWAFGVQIGKSSVKITEYYFALTWILTALSAGLLLRKKEQSYPILVIILCGLSIFSVLPVVGYHILPVSAQINRLEKLLVAENMLVDGKITPAVVEPARDVRESITDVVDYLAYDYDATLPAWFDRKVSDYTVFKTTFGFEQVREEPSYTPGERPNDYLSTNLTLSPGAIDIRDYEWMVTLQDDMGKSSSVALVEGDKGTYTLEWTTEPKTGLPTLTISLNDQVLKKEDLRVFIDTITTLYPPGQSGQLPIPIAEMSYTMETPEVSVLVVFSNVDINVNVKEDQINYWFNVKGIYLKEKP